MLEHGGNITAASLKFGIPLADWLDLSTGINPDSYPIPEIPPAVWQKLPIDDDGLIEAACAYYGCQFALPTAGSQAALQTLPKLRSPSKVAMLSPMYNEHAQAWRRCGHDVRPFSGRPDNAILENADVVLICNPNNPTATRFSTTDLLDWHAQLAKRAGWLVVDEAFMDATPEHSIAQYAHLEGLFVLRSFGKFFGLAGARVGFLLANAYWLNKAQEIIGPWALTGASRFIAQQALRDQAWQQGAREQLSSSSQRLAALLHAHGLKPVAGTALFQFVPTLQATAWHQHLAAQGIWVRLFTEFSALRFGLPPEHGWATLEAALKTFNDSQN